MLTVDTIGRIRREYFVGKKTIREISRSLKVSRKVIRKAIRTPATEFAYVRKRQVQPQLGLFVGRLNQLLEENIKRSARERLATRRLHELLGAEGYVGAHDSIQRHVRAWRRDHGKTDAVFVPLWFSPGEAYQFDWLHETVVLGGTTTEIKVAAMELAALPSLSTKAHWTPGAALVCAVLAKPHEPFCIVSDVAAAPLVLSESVSDGPRDTV